MCKICGFNNLREKCNKPKILAQMMSDVVSVEGKYAQTIFEYHH